MTNRVEKDFLVATAGAVVTGLFLARIMFLRAHGLGGPMQASQPRPAHTAPSADRAEIGVTVADEYQRRMAGTLVLQQLIAIARSTGVRELVALIADENRGMLAVIRNLHLPTQRTIDHGVHRIVLSVDGSPAEIDCKLRIAAC